MLGEWMEQDLTTGFTAFRPATLVDLILQSIWTVAGPMASCPPPPPSCDRCCSRFQIELPPYNRIRDEIKFFARGTAPNPPPPAHNLYRGSIQSVPWPGRHIRPTPFSQSGHSGSTYSSDSDASSSNMSCNSGCSSGSASASTEDFFGDIELMKIARQMVRDGYAQRTVQAFYDSGGIPANWFFELDVDWVLQICNEHVLRQQLQHQGESLEDLVQRWIRALVLIVFIIRDGVFTLQCHELAHFGRACISAMVVFVDGIVHVLKVENLHAVVNMSICISRASHHMFTMFVNSVEAQTIFNEIGSLLERQELRLNEAISSLMEDVRALMEDDDSWAIEISRGRGGVHKNTRYMVTCILSARGHNTGYIGDMTQAMLNYLKDLLLRKSELCLDSSLRYLFLLNNFYSVAQLAEQCEYGNDRKLTPECEKYMDKYLDVSWGHVLSCIPKSYVRGPLHCWVKNSSMVKFESAFHKTYQAQKFWKVPDPWLRDTLRRAINKRVISGYRDYLKEDQELEIQVSNGSSPDALEEMLGELFEG